MKFEKKWRVGLMCFLVISLTASSVVLTITIFNWNLKRAQLTVKGGDILFENDSLSRHPLSLLQELAEGKIQKNDPSKVDLTVTNVVTQFLSTMRPNDLPRYSTDTILGFRYAVRHRSITDQRSQAQRIHLPPFFQELRVDSINSWLSRVLKKSGAG